MIRRTLARWLNRAKSSAHGDRTANRRRPAQRRPLRLESLEGRQLMAVAVIDQTFKDFDFSGPVTLTGNLSGSYGTHVVSGRFSGNLNISGGMHYTSSLDGTGQAAAAGPVTATIYGYGDLPTLNVDGNTGPGGISEVAGKFSAVLPPDGNLGAVTLTGAINTKDFSATGKVNFALMGTIIGNGTWTGKLTPSNPQPLDVAVTAKWDPDKFGTVDVDLTAGGSVQTAATRATPVAKVTAYYGDANGAVLGKAVATIPVLWNQATGSYEISGLPNAPLPAAKLVLVTTYPGTTKTLTLDLPARPTVSIDNITVTPPAVGTGDAIFTVSLSGPTLSPIKVKFATVNGTAVKAQDFAARKGQLTFLPGGPLTQQIVIKVKRDTTPGSEDFYVQLAPPTWATLGGTGKGTGTITF